MKESTKNKIFFWVFVSIWGLLIVWNALTPPKEFSESENRYLKTFPKFTVDTLLDGKFMDDVNTYLNDQFAGRPHWVTTQSLMEYGIGKRETNGVYLGKNALLGDMAKPDENLTDKNVSGINTFAARYEIPVYVMLVPSSADIQSRNLPAFAEGWDENAYIVDAYNGLTDSVTPVAVYNKLASHSDGYIYYQTDHHWTSYGAYLAYEELASAMGVAPRSMQEMSVSVLSSDFFGTYHSKTGFPLIAPDKMEAYQSGTVSSYEVFDGIETKEYPSIYFDEYLSKKDKYSYFLGQVQPYVTIHTGADSGKKLIVFKDSYAHSLIPMLLDEFSEIRLVDLRFINPSDLDAKLNISGYDEALFLYSTDVFSHQLGSGLFLTA